jgi:hypothetical protein
VKSRSPISCDRSIPRTVAPSTAPVGSTASIGYLLPFCPLQ